MYKHLILTEKEDVFEGELLIDGTPRYIFQKDSFIHNQYGVDVDKETQKRLIIQLANDYPWDKTQSHPLCLIEINSI